ncbi:uncharacterized protein METZ01_LOCUS276171, partial [marine metagenome]
VSVSPPLPRLPWRGALLWLPKTWNNLGGNLRQARSGISQQSVLHGQRQEHAQTHGQDHGRKGQPVPASQLGGQRQQACP